MVSYYLRVCALLVDGNAQQQQQELWAPSIQRSLTCEWNWIGAACLVWIGHVVRVWVTGKLIGCKMMYWSTCFYDAPESTEDLLETKWLLVAGCFRANGSLRLQLIWYCTGGSSSTTIICHYESPWQRLFGCHSCCVIGLERPDQGSIVCIGIASGCLAICSRQVVIAHLWLWSSVCEITMLIWKAAMN